MRSRSALTGAAVAAVVVASLAGGTAQAVETPAGGSGDVRWSGANRYLTAVEVSERTYAPTVPVVYLASGENYPDALAAGPAASDGQGPVLLTPQSSLPTAVADEITRLQPEKVVVLGGPTVVSADVADAAEKAAGATVERIAGENRYETAALLAGSSAKTVYLASGQAFPDALAAGPAAIRENGALLLTKKDTLPTATADKLKDLNPTTVVIVGGTSAVSGDVATDVAKYAKVVRVGGRDRYQTAAKVALRLWTSTGGTVFYATGLNFPDALAGAPSAGVNDAPILLTKQACNPYPTTAATEDLDPKLRVALGGKAVTYLGDTTCGPSPAYPFPYDLDCKDFSSQAAAQRWYDYWYPYVGDYFRLDGDNDGKVCEYWR